MEDDVKKVMLEAARDAHDICDATGMSYDAVGRVSGVARALLTVKIFEARWQLYYKRGRGRIKDDIDVRVKALITGMEKKK